MNKKHRTRWLVAFVYFGQILRFGSVLLIVSAFSWTLNGAFLTSSSTAAEFFATVLGRGAASLLAVTLTAAAGSWIRSESLKLLELDGHDALAKDPRPPVVYFRPFAQDLHQRRAARRAFFFPPLAPEELGHTAEQAMARMLNAIGPRVAIGQPGEPTPPVAGGFSRLYVSNEEWQREADMLLRTAALLVFVAGTSDGLFWEIRRALSIVNTSRLLMVICGTSGFELFRQRMRQELGVELPPLELHALSEIAINGVDALVSFDDHGTATLHQRRWKFPTIQDAWAGRGASYAPLHLQADGFLLDAMRSLLEHHGIMRADPRLPYLSAPPMSAPMLWVHRGLLITVTAVLAAAFLVLLYLWLFGSVT